ncbi:MAG: metallophosphoesterase [Brevundimonas sp.]|uniref:metallophosphoesterase n=1 Tax=Brevundimonas sp. TaxID=1871086 RepID=UPI004033DA62
MAGPDAVLSLAGAAAIIGPAIVFWLVRACLRDGRPRSATVLGLAGGLFWALGVWGFFIEPRSLTVRHVTVESAAWSGPPVRIGVISDTHVSAPHTDVPRIVELVERINRERPDLVVLLGDYAGGHDPAEVRARPERSEILQGVLAFRGLTAPLGVFGVLGNHDSWFDEASLDQALTQAGVTVLENRAVPVNSDGGRFWVAGLSDMQSRRTQTSVPLALADVAEGEPSVLLTHWPDPFAEVPAGVALTLAGHTHCGQVNLPLVGRPVLPSPASYRWPCGLYDEGGRKLFVTGGVGVSILPVRFRARPEIVIVTLQAPDGD